MILLLLERAVNGSSISASDLSQLNLNAQRLLLSVVEKLRGFPIKQPLDHDSQVSCNLGGKYRHGKSFRVLAWGIPLSQPPQPYLLASAATTQPVTLQV